MRLANAFEAAQDLLFLSTPVEGLEFAMRLLIELIPCEATSACLYDINTDEFRFVTMSGPGAEARQGEAVPNNTGLLGVASRQIGQVLIRLEDNEVLGRELRNYLKTDKYLRTHDDGTLPATHYCER